MFGSVLCTGRFLLVRRVNYFELFLATLKLLDGKRQLKRDLQLLLLAVRGMKISAWSWLVVVLFVELYKI